MKKKILSIAIVVVVIFVLIFIFVIPKKREFGNFNKELKTVKDGKYIGTDNNGIISVELEVIVKNHKIDDIKIIKHRNGKGEDAEKIINDVMVQQTLDVDTVSGATYSSYTILKAIENAIKK